uniref:Uncharacterized protein n=1 Tax=Moniliophthora roreri TaxID=221103 RepID=A0A0W0FW46_MONRR
MTFTKWPHVDKYLGHMLRIFDPSVLQNIRGVAKGWATMLSDIVKGIIGVEHFAGSSGDSGDSDVLHKVSSVIGCDVSVLLAASGDIVKGVFGIKSGVEHIADGGDVAHNAGGVIGGNMSDSVGVIGNIERDVVEAVAGIGNVWG